MFINKMFLNCLQEDAERLFQSSGRYDLLNKLLQGTGEWDKAHDLADKFDRIHLRSTHYNHAKVLEASGKEIFVGFILKLLD